ncbi:SDR family oxidoreductase [Dactylosporangium vinaceum]|uniref:SDR family oxidoreductase n=1 Tax=Dactylosporangium vinaceum TaxID=53362 RepID=A0ABV5MBV1_9ACTN|nr:SDR family oxidoreductase [Dactylosporangium vinaceum]UAC01307.1 SDR family oxidoreductase [Dactylosporangium vinaceum]
MTRVAVVTGGSRGIGRAVAQRLDRDGLAVVIGYAGNDAAAQEAVASMRQARALRADVADETAVAALFDLAEREFGGVDVVVNAAGRMTLQPVAELDLDALDRMHRTNIRGTFVVSREAARRLRSGGALINFSTSQTRLLSPAYAGYAASKAAVEALSLVLARELRGRDITVNAVAPGPTATELFLDGKDEATVERIAKLSPMERLGRPEDIAEVVAGLAGAMRWVNGQTIFANGAAA